MKKLLCFKCAKEALGIVEVRKSYNAVCESKKCKDQPPKPCVFVEVKR